MIAQHAISKILPAIEGGRRPTEDAGSIEPPDPEVVDRTTRRNLKVAYKLKVLETVAALKQEGHGAVGAYLRREGLYYSNARSWLHLEAEGRLAAYVRGPKASCHDALVAENKKLRRKLEQAEKRLAKTEMIVELPQEKLSAILYMEREMSEGVIIRNHQYDLSIRPLFLASGCGAVTISCEE